MTRHRAPGGSSRRRCSLRWASFAAVALAVGAFASNAATADPTPRERYWKDGDAVALAAALSTGTDPADREDAALARLAADRRATTGAGADVPALARGVDALRRADLDGARAACSIGDVTTSERDGVRRSWFAALCHARRGRDDEALRRLVDGPVPVLSRDGASLAIFAAALPDDDRELLGGLLRAALARAGSLGRADVVVALAEAATAIDANDGALALVYGARILRRAGRPADSSALLEGAAAIRCGRSRPSLRLERAILAWRRNDAATARAEASPAPADAKSLADRETPWAFLALARAGAACAVVPAPPLLAREGDGDADARAIARLLTTIGIAVRPEDVTTRAAAQSTTPADPAFLRRYLDALDVVRLETAGDPSVIEGALARGLPVLLWRPRRDEERFTDRPVLLRGHDPVTGLVCADEPDPRRLDVFPSSWARKARALVVAPKSRSAELLPWRDGIAARRGVALVDALSLLFGPEPGSAGPALESRSAFAGDPTFDLYAGYATYVPAFAAHDVAGLARATAILLRSSATAPVTPLERLMRAKGALGADADPALAELTEAAREEGNASWIEITRFVILENSRRHVEALEALARARAFDPLDVRTLYFRSGTRRLLGDGPGARADLVRVLERRPDHVPAAEDLAGAYVEDGAPERALAVVKRLVEADPAVASTRRVRQLRQRVEARLVRKARSADDLSELATSPEPDVRAEVAWTASSFETDAAEALLRRFLVDPDESVRRRAALAYQRPSLTDRATRDVTLADALSARFAVDPAPAVREALARALARVETPDVRVALAARLSGPSADPAVGVRATLADLLSTTSGFSGGPGDAAVERTKRALVGALSDAESAVRTPAIASLRRITGTNEGFEPDDPPDRREAAIAAWNRRLASGR